MVRDDDVVRFEPSANVPAVTDVGPVKEFAPFIVSLPAPDLANPPSGVPPPWLNAEPVVMSKPLVSILAPPAKTLLAIFAPMKLVEVPEGLSSPPLKLKFRAAVALAPPMKLAPVSVPPLRLIVPPFAP